MVFRKILAGLLLCAAMQVHAGTVKVSCVGDSITQGAGSSGGQTYPVQLQALIGAGYQITNHGTSGRTMLGPGFGDFPYVSDANYLASSTYQPNVVVIMLGTNDSKPQNWANKVQFEADATAMVTHYATLASKPQVYLVLCCPVYNAGGFGITSPIVQNEVLPILRTVAAKTSTPLIDVNTALSGHPEWFPDNVHPNNAGYAVLAQTVMNAITMAGPTRLTATTPASGKVELTWVDEAANEAEYTIERKVTGGQFAKIGTATANAATYSDTSVAPFTEYTYRVRAVNAAGESPFSNEVKITSRDVPPAAPSGLTAVQAVSGYVDLDWNANSNNEWKFVIERKNNYTGEFDEIGEAVLFSSFRDMNVRPATMYTYRVYAYNFEGFSASSNEAVITTESGWDPTPEDSDGDGFSNALETAAGTDPLNAGDTPMDGEQAGEGLAFEDIKLSIKLNFAKSGKDSIIFSGVLIVPDDIFLTRVVLDVGGVSEALTLDRSGVAKTATSFVSIKTGSGPLRRYAKLTAKFSKGNFAQALVDEGLTNSFDVKSVAVPVSLLLDNGYPFVDYFRGIAQVKYKAKAGKSGVAK